MMHNQDKEKMKYLSKMVSVNYETGHNNKLP